MTYATTFSGIGGWEIGLDSCGWELRWQCERDPFCRAVLTERFGVPICPDIGGLTHWLKRRFGSLRRASVDALIGSPPCQPFSAAGQQRGTDDERHLYPLFLHAVRLLEPRWVLMEQVPNIFAIDGGRAFGGYLAGLAALRYDILWHCLPASAVGANHQRDRVWIVAHSDWRRCQQRHASQRRISEPHPLRANVSHPDAQRRVGRSHHQGQTAAERRRLAQALAIFPDAGREGRECGGLGMRSASAREILDHGIADGGEARWQRVVHACECDEDGNCPVCGIDFGDCGCPGPTQEEEYEYRDGPDGLEARRLVPHSEQQRLEGQPCGRPAARPAYGPSHGDYSQWWAVEPDVGRVAHGVPFRVDRLKALGNAVLPVIPRLIGQAINFVEQDFVRQH